MISFLALYRGNTLDNAKLVAVSTNGEIIGAFAERLLDEQNSEADFALRALQDGKRQALRLIKREEET